MMSLSAPRSVAAGAAALAMLLVLVLAVPAARAHDCVRGYVCLYDNINFQGQRLVAWNPSVSYNPKCYVLPTNVRDRASSWVNVSGHAMAAMNVWAIFSALLWNMPNNHENGWVGSTVNDKVDFLLADNGMQSDC